MVVEAYEAEIDNISLPSQLRLPAYSLEACSASRTTGSPPAAPDSLDDGAPQLRAPPTSVGRKPRCRSGSARTLMRLTGVVFIGLLTIVASIPYITCEKPQTDGPSSTQETNQPLDPRRVPRTVTVHKDGLPYDFTLTRSAEAASPITALRTKVAKKFADVRYKNFFTMRGEPLDQFALLPENSQVVVQRQDDLWFWPGVRNGTKFEPIETEPGHSINLSTLSMSPRVFLVENVATKEECDYLIAQSREKGVMVNSGVTLSAHNDLQRNESRTSKNVRFENDKFYFRSDPIFEKVLQRVSKIARIPADFCDPQLLHYDAGQRFNAHYDWLKLPYNDTKTPQRVLTILLYLNDVDDGGETIFPSTSEDFLKSENKVFDESLCHSEFEFLRVKPRAGAAALFYNLFEPGHISNKVDHKTIHAGCPFKSGEKWAVNYWFYNRQPSINLMETNDYANLDPSHMHTT